jgi:hypothetical protein
MLRNSVAGHGKDFRDSRGNINYEQLYSFRSNELLEEPSQRSLHQVPGRRSMVPTSQSLAEVPKTTPTPVAPVRPHMPNEALLTAIFLMLEELDVRNLEILNWEIARLRGKQPPN